MEQLLIWTKDLISLLFYYTKLNSLINSLIKRWHGNLPVITILCYHSIPGPQKMLFERQIDYLSNHNYSFLSGQDLLTLINDPILSERRGKYVCLTFDDCYEDNYVFVRPILLAKQIPAVFFAVSSKLGKTVDWTDNPAGTSLMTPEQLKEMALSFDIGSHTLTHAKLAELEPEEVLREVKESKAELRALLQKPIIFFAYPNGSLSAEAVKIVEECEFSAAFTIDQHRNYNYSERFLLGRHIINPDDFRGFKIKLAGGFDWLYHLRKLLKRLVSNDKFKHFRKAFIYMNAGNSRNIHT
jgi:peptidoglycan/xylan/chitin deacetylase (PgdA/CDA1 family)